MIEVTKERLQRIIGEPVRYGDVADMNIARTAFAKGWAAAENIIVNRFAAHGVTPQAAAAIAYPSQPKLRVVRDPLECGPSRASRWWRYDPKLKRLETTTWNRANGEPPDDVDWFDVALAHYEINPTRVGIWQGLIDAPYQPEDDGA